jgi:uncharacterized RDD family membrane protein YckC
LNPTDVVGRRVAATVIDGLINAAIVWGAFFALTDTIPGVCLGGGFTLNGDCHGFTDDGNRTTWFIIAGVVPILMSWVLPALTGYTPGKAIVGIRIIRRDGRPPGFWKVFVRSVMWIVDAFPYFIPYLTGFIVALNDKQEHKRLGDRVAGTLVVDKSAAGRPFQAPPPGPQAFSSPQAFNAGQQYQQPPQSQPVAAPGGGPAPGWYDDPQGEARLRYWDGSTWTSHTSA